MEQPFDLDAALDAAFGVEPAAVAGATVAAAAPAAPAAPCNVKSRVTPRARLLRRVRSAACSGGVPSPQPQRLPLQPLCGSPCSSPALSCDSVTLHASPPHDILWLRSPDAEREYSPVRPAASSASQQAAPAPGVQQWMTQTTPAWPWLTALPREVLLRVLSCLPADALTTLAQSSSALRCLADEPGLWRRLFVLRWGRPRGGQQHGPAGWKARYMERDAAELREMTAAGDADMRAMFAQAHIARRQTAPPACRGGAGTEGAQTVVVNAGDDDDDDVAARVRAWRRARGFADVGLAHQQQQGLEQPHVQQERDLLPDSRQRAAGADSAQALGLVRRASWPMAGCQFEQHLAAPVQQPQPTRQKATGRQHALPPSLPVQRQQQQQALPSLLAAQLPQTPEQQPQSSLIDEQPPVQLPPRSMPTQRTAARRRRRWTRIGTMYCDELTGFVHACGEECLERVVEPSSGLLVCPISGVAFERILTHAEEAAEEGDGAGDDDWGGSGERGRLGAAFTAGYYAADERELARTCGVRLSR